MRQQLYDLLKNKLAEKLMHFGSFLRGSRGYWTKCHSELINIINQWGCPTLFFTFSAVDTKWPDLHSVMPSRRDSDRQSEHARNIQNVIPYPHIVSMYMHQRFNILCDIVLQRYLGARYFWYRFVVLPFR